MHNDIYWLNKEKDKYEIKLYKNWRLLFAKFNNKRTQRNY